MLTPATAQVVLGAGAAGVSFSCSLHTCTCSTLVPQCEHAVQAVVTSATVYKPREFKSLCARSAGPSCPYCAGWVAVEAQHSVLRYYSRYTTSLVTWPAHTGGWGEARGNYSLQQPGPGPGGWVAAASLCSLSPRLCGVSCAVLGCAGLCCWMWLPRWPESD